MPPQQQGNDQMDGVEGLEEAEPTRTWFCARKARNGTTTELSQPQETLQQQQQQEESFVKYIFTAKGPPQIFLWSLFYAVAIGSTISIIPAVITDRYARLNHGFDGNFCSTYSADDKPPQCRAGSNDAMNASAVCSFVRNMLTFVTGPLTGSISDEYGRRNILLASSFLGLFSPVFLVLLQLDDTMNPAWYYAADAIRGLLSWMAIALSSLSDVLPKKWRAPGFGLLLAGFSLGFAFSPLLALGLDHLYLSIFSCALMVSLFLLALCFLPETLSREKSENTRQLRIANTRDEGRCGCLVRNIKRPVTELLILNRSRLFRLLSSLAFFSGLVLSADTLLVFYVQDKFGATDKDVAVFLVMIGVLNITVQGIILKPYNECVGEKVVLITAFFFGALHNLMYGLGKNKTFIYIGGALASIREMSFPTISAIKANNVEETEQGQIQGALYAVSCLASAIGPIMLRFVYYGTKSNNFSGPGIMFVTAAALDMVAVGVSFALPKDEVDSRGRDEMDTSNNNVGVDESNLSAPLLDDSNTT